MAGVSKTVIDETVIDEVVRRIVAAARPQKVVLFGSRAREDNRPGSDLDLLVIQASEEPRYRRSVPLYSALADLPVEVEIVVYTPEETEEWTGVRQALVTTALREGKVLYEEAA
jgi:predicted nucleotidyltransferase